MRRLKLLKGYKLVIMGFYILTTVLFLGNFCGYAKEVRGVTDDTIKIGMIADLTGPATAFSHPVVAALRMLYRYTNEQGGINGRQIRLTVEDDRYIIPLALSAFKKLVFREKVFALHGPVSSHGAIALMRQIEKNKVPQICYAPTKKVLVPVQRYIFTCVGLYDDAVKLLFEYIFETKKERPSIVGIVYPDLEMGKVAFRAALVEAKRHGVKIHGEIFNIGATDATSQVLNLKRKKVKHIIIQNTPAGTVALLRATYSLGLSAKYYGTIASTNEDIIEIGGPALEDFIGSHCYSAWYEDTPGTIKLRELSRRYYNKDTPYMSRACSVGSVAGLILNEGIKNAGRDLNHETLVNGLGRIKNLDTQGLSGRISYSKTDHQGIEERKLYKVDRNKKIFVAISGWLKSKY